MAGTTTATEAHPHELRAEIDRLRAALATVQAENRRLELQVELFTRTDPVTGLTNRSGLFEALETAAERLERHDEPFTVLAVSIDTGDDDPLDVDTVRDLAALLGGGLRRLDRVGRVDDETFVAVLSNLHRGHLDRVLTRIRRALGGTTLGRLASGTAMTPKTAALVVATPGSIDDPGLLLDAVLAQLAEGDPVRVLLDD